MSRVQALAGDPWWLPYESVLLAHLTQPFQLHLHQLPVYWTLTECCVQPHCYWKGFVIWKIASNKVQKAHAATYVSYRFLLHGAIEAERPRVISWMRPLCRDCAVPSRACVLVLQSWRIEGIGHTQAFSPRLLTPAISCEIWKDFSIRSPSLCWADLCRRGGGRVWSNLHCNMSRSIASSLKLHWSEGYGTCLQKLPE